MVVWWFGWVSEGEGYGVRFDWYLTGVKGLTLVFIIWGCGGLICYMGQRKRMGGLLRWTWTIGGVVLLFFLDPVWL